MKTTITIEKNFKEYLNTLKNLNATATSIKESYDKYNHLAEITMEFVSKVVLLSSKNRNLINSTGYDFSMFADDITMHIMDKLDAVLSCSPDQMIPFIVTMTNRKVIDICRKWMRTYPTHTQINSTSAMDVNNNNNNKDYNMRPIVTFLDDIVWGLIADETDMEAEILRQEETKERHSTVLNVLKNANSCSRFEIVSLLYTKVFTNNDNKCMKTRTLAETLDKFGLNSVSETCLKTAKTVFNIALDDYFDSFTNDEMPAYNSIEELCDKISHASNNCSVKLCKKIGAKRLVKKRTK